MGNNLYYALNTDIRLMFESPDDLIAERHFREVAVIDSRGLTVVATTEAFVQKVNANIFKKLLIQIDNLHMISSNKFSRLLQVS